MKIPSITSLIALIVLFFSGVVMAGDYGAWQPYRDWPGLDYRVRRTDIKTGDNKYEWDVQFRNRYQEMINFGFHLDEDGATKARLTNRTTLKTGQGAKTMGDSGTTWALLHSTTHIEVFVGEVRFGKDDSGPYAKPEYLGGSPHLFTVIP